MTQKTLAVSLRGCHRVTRGTHVMKHTFATRCTLAGETEKTTRYYVPQRTRERERERELDIAALRSASSFRPQARYRFSSARFSGCFFLRSSHLTWLAGFFLPESGRVFLSSFSCLPFATFRAGYAIIARLRRAFAEREKERSRESSAKSNVTRVFSAVWGRRMKLYAFFQSVFSFYQF